LNGFDFENRLSFGFLSVVLCDPLCLNEQELNTKDTKGITKVHKGYIIELSLKFYP